MLVKSFLMTLGGIIFVVGAILFPMPVPIGLPLMIIGLSLMFKASDKVKRIFVRSIHKNRHTSKVWRMTRDMRKRNNPTSDVTKL